MSYFVVVPGALVPIAIAPQLLARATLPRLARRLERAQAAPPQRTAPGGAAHLEWLWNRFGGEGQPVTGPYAWQALSDAALPTEAPLWQADPIHFAFARDHMLVSALDAEAAVSVEESNVLAAEAAVIATEFNTQLHAVDPRHWFLSFDPPWSLTTIAFDAALGRSAEHVLPQGDAAARWRKLLTEIQISWHQHPVNEQREAQGVRTINGIWLHGGGTWRALAKRPFEVIVSDDPIVRGWALASGLARNALLAPDTLAAGSSATLVYCPDLLIAASHEDWDAWLQTLARVETFIESHLEHAFEQGHRDVTLVLGGREFVRSVTVRASDRLRFWRGGAIAAVFSEPEGA
jgi:hypothetical protein